MTNQLSIKNKERSVSVGVAIPLDVLEKLDETRGVSSRSRLIVNIVESYLNEIEAASMSRTDGYINIPGSVRKEAQSGC